MLFYAPTTYLPTLPFYPTNKHCWSETIEEESDCFQVVIRGHEDYDFILSWTKGQDECSYQIGRILGMDKARPCDDS
jgi:hypothetical protein